MKVYVVFVNSRGSHYAEDCDVIEKIFLSREAAEKFVMSDPVNDMFSKVEVAGCPGVSWYYFMEYPAYRIEEHEIED